MHNTLSCRSLGHGFGKKELFSDFSARFAHGLTTVIGPNGSGKSTLLRILAGLCAPRHGTTYLNETPLHKVALGKRACTIAYLPQTTPLYFDMPAAEVVMMGRAPHRPRWSSFTKEDHTIVSNSLAQVGLDNTDIASRGVLSLSGGERQRVMLARLLATNTDILILDEPTTGLDIGHALRFLELLKSPDLKTRTIIMAIHELEWARRYADTILCVCKNGDIVSGTSAEVLTSEIVESTFGVKMNGEGAMHFSI